MKKKTKLLLLFILTTIVFNIFFYYLFFYLPLANNQELFPDNDIILKNTREIPTDIQEKYGIDTYYIQEYSIGYDNIYYVDGREIEEYYYMQKDDSIHLRTYDIKTPYDIMEALNISEQEFYKSLIIIFCHDGTRSSEVAEKLNLSNIKFLISGVPVLFDYVFPKDDIFPAYIIDRDFTIYPEEAIALIEKNAFLIDGRDYEDNLFDGAYRFRIGNLSTEEYNNKLEKIIEQIDNEIIIIADGYTDTFYIKLLIHRLNQQLDLNLNKFHVVFGQNKKFSELLKNYYENN